MKLQPPVQQANAPQQPQLNQTKVFTPTQQSSQLRKAQSSKEKPQQPANSSPPPQLSKVQQQQRTQSNGKNSPPPPPQHQQVHHDDDDAANVESASRTPTGDLSSHDEELRNDLKNHINTANADITKPHTLAKMVQNLYLEDAIPTAMDANEDKSARFDILLSADNYIDVEGDWGGSWGNVNFAQLKNRFDSLMPPASDADREARKYFKEILDKHLFIDMLTHRISLKSIYKKISKDPYGIIYTGWVKHAVGVFWRKVSSKKIEVAIQNTGQGCDYHGATTHAEQKSSHLTNAGVIIFEDIPNETFLDFIKRMDFMNNTDYPKNVRPAVFYRLACESLFQINYEDPNFTPPVDNPNVKCVIELPIQKGGDCAFRAVLFTILAHPGIAPRSTGTKSNIVRCPRYFWDWYAHMVVVSQHRINHVSNKWKFTFAEFKALKERSLNLISWLNEVDPEKVHRGLQERRNELLNLSKLWEQKCFQWYSDNVYGKDSLKIFHFPRKITVYEVDAQERCFIRKDKTVKFRSNPRMEFDLFKAADELCRFREITHVDNRVELMWMSITKTLYLKLPYNHQTRNDGSTLSRLEIVSIMHVLYKILYIENDMTQSISHENDETKNDMIGVRLRAIYLCATACTSVLRVYDMMLLYGMLYIGLRRLIAKTIHHQKTFKNDMSDYSNFLRNVVDSVHNSHAFDGPIYNRTHAKIAENVLRELNVLKVAGQTNDILRAASQLCKPISREAEAEYTDTFHPESKWKWNNEFSGVLYARHVLQSRYELPSTFQDVRSKALLVHLAFVFNYGFGFKSLVPIVLHQLSPVVWYQGPSMNIVPLGNADFISPDKTSIDALISEKCYRESRASMTLDKERITFFNTSKDVFMTFGAVDMTTSPSRYGTILDGEGRGYKVPSQRSSNLRNLPPFDVAFDAILARTFELIDEANPKTKLMSLHQWNMKAYSIFYLACLYQPIRDQDPEDWTSWMEAMAEVFDALSSHQKAGEILKLLADMLAGKDDAVLDPSNDVRFAIWDFILNCPFDARQDLEMVRAVGIECSFESFNGIPEGDMYGEYETIKMNERDKRIQGVGVLAHEKHTTPKTQYNKFIKNEVAAKLYDRGVSNEILYDWILTHLCHEAVAHWTRFRPKKYAVPVKNQICNFDELMRGASGLVDDHIRDQIYVTPSVFEGRQAMNARMRCTQHHQREYSIMWHNNMKLDEQTFVPTRRRVYDFDFMNGEERWNNEIVLKVLTPLPPHPHFQLNFDWSQMNVKGKPVWYGTNKNKTLNNVNSYCLLYEEQSETVVRTPPLTTNGKQDDKNKGGCLLPLDDADDGNRSLVQTINASASTDAPSAKFVSLNTILSMNNLSSDKGLANLTALVARLLTFCFADMLVVWEWTTAATSSTKNTRRWSIEVTSHDVVFYVESDGKMTIQGLQICEYLYQLHHNFWCYNMPSVFYAVDENDAFSLVIFDVHRKDPGTVRSNALKGLFGSNDNKKEMDDVGIPKAVLYREEIHFNDYLRFSVKPRMHVIKIHASGLLLLPTEVAQARALRAIAHRFGRSDVEDEAQRMETYLRKIEEYADYKDVVMPVFNDGEDKNKNVFPRIDATNFARSIDRIAMRSVLDPKSVRKSNSIYVNGKLKRNPSVHDILETKSTVELLNGYVNSSFSKFIWNSPVRIVRRLDLQRVVDRTSNSYNALIMRSIYNYGGEASMIPFVSDILRTLPQQSKIEHMWFNFISQITPRPQQIEFANSVTRNFEGQNPEIHNLIMGAGKTAVITPLVIINTIYGSDKTASNPIVIVTPAKLLAQTVQLLIPLGMNLSAPIYVPKKSTSHFWKTKTRQNMTTDVRLHGGSLGGSDAAPPSSSPREIFIISDVSLKESLITRTENSPKNFRYLLDEADMLMNPITTELNIPRGVISFCQKTSASVVDINNAKCVHVMINSVFLTQDKLIENNMNEMVQSSFSAILKFAYTRVYRLHYGHLRPNRDVMNRAFMLMSTSRVNQSTSRAFGAAATLALDRIEQQDMLMQETAKEVLAQFKNKRDVDVETIHNQNPHEMLEQSLYTLHNYDIMAVPYTFADVPSIGSEFSDPILTVVLTVLSLIKGGLSELRVYHVLLSVFGKYHDDDANANANANVHDEEHALYAKIKKKYDPFIQNSNRWKWVIDNIKVTSKDMDLIHVYALEFIPDQVRVYGSVRSSAGLDIVMAGYHPLRSGFTGTPEKIDEIVDSVPIQIRPKNVDEDENTAMSKIRIVHSTTNPVIETIYEQMSIGVFNVIIDVGAVFLNVTPHQILCALIRARDGDVDRFRNKQIAFWDESDQPCYADVTGSVFPWDRVQKPNQFVFYDNAHTTGTDAKLLDSAHAAITVRKDTRFRDFIQGLFRLRKIAKVPKTACSLVTTMTSITNTRDLRSWLDANDDKYVSSQKALRIQHNALAIVRSSRFVAAPATNIEDPTVVQTSIEYLRGGNEPFSTYLIKKVSDSIGANVSVRKRMIDKIKEIKNENELVDVQRTNVAIRENTTTNESVRQNEQEQQQEQMQMQITTIFNKTYDRSALDLRQIVTEGKIIADIRRRVQVQNITKSVAVSPSFDMYKFKSKPLTMSNLFRPLLVRMTMIDIDKPKVIIVTFAEGVLLKDNFETYKVSDNIKHVSILDCENNEWFSLARKGAQPPLPPLPPAAQDPNQMVEVKAKAVVKKQQPSKASQKTSSKAASPKAPIASSWEQPRRRRDPWQKI